MSWLHRRGVRGGLLVAAAAIAVTGTLVVAYELALARVPEHRAALERLVRAQTGLDVRFNELSLRWGWYGPEAVFRRVELGEPGRANVLLRAPQLVVGVNAWQSMQTGQLAAGRITLIAPDIDLERLTHGERPSEPVVSRREPSSADAERANRARLFKLWRGGRIEIEGGTLRLPDPSGSVNPLIVQVRRAALRRSENEWNGFGLVFLPERLGRAARVVVQLQGDPNNPQSLSGGLRFEGARLSFAGWREVLSSRPMIARNLPTAGAGDLTMQLTLRNGRIEKANGTVKASDLAFGTPQWADSVRASIARNALKLDYVAGEWRFVSRANGGQLQVEQLVLSRADKDTPLPRVSLDFSAGHVHGSVPRAPLASATAVARWLAPTLLPTGVQLTGTAESVEFDWNKERPEGSRLAASARTNDASVASASGSFRLRDLRTRFSGTESLVVLEVEAPAARLELETSTEPLTDIALESVLQITRDPAGWRVASDRLSVDYDGGKLVLRGALTGSAGDEAPVLDARGTLSYPNVATLHTALANAAARALGPAASRLTAGRIEEARFELSGPANDLFTSPNAARPSASLGLPQAGTRAFKGSLSLKDARLAAADVWPEMTGVDARLDWNGARVRASFDQGTAGAFDLDGVQIQWDATGARSSRLTGRARANVQKALAWVRAHPELQAYAPQLRDIRASGEALFDFEIDAPGAATRGSAASAARPRSHVAAVLENVDLTLAPGLPTVESMRGSLAFENGHLQRSTLTGTWQNRPLTLKVSERRDYPGAISLQAQGIFDAEQLVAISQFHAIADVRGEAAWTGEFQYTPALETQPAHWQGRADSNLVGIESELPGPLGKLAAASLPMHVQLTGAGGEGEVRAKIGDRVRSTFALQTRKSGAWEIEHGALEFGSGPGTLVAFLRSEDSGMSLRVQSQSVGLLTGMLVSAGPQVTVRDVQWSKETLTGEGSVQCAPRLARCTAQFHVHTDSAARALADLGFRPDVAAASGVMSGEISWQPHTVRPWLETAAGHVSLRLDDGIVRTGVNSASEPFPLLTVPALLTAMSRPGPQAVSTSEMRFRRLDAEFDIQDGDASTSNLHFDGDAEILVRGRTGLLARDYDHEAWILRGEERIPASLRRLAATPRVAAAWIALRELVGADSANRSRVVLHLRGTWAEPVVTND